MLAFVAGGAASGKSAWAEALAVALGGKKCYLATMEPFGKEAQERIQKHRALRREKGFQTVEIYTSLADKADSFCCDTVLLECMTNWMANEMYSPSGAGQRGWTLYRHRFPIWWSCLVIYFAMGWTMGHTPRNI